jgi:hypothetical protein
MTTDQKIRQVIDICWTSFKNKVASGLLNPENEKMMQLQFAQTLLALTSIYEYRPTESIKILLEVPVNINKQRRRIIDIVIQHSDKGKITNFPIELKCFRRLTRNGQGSRGAQNLGMYDYWEDIENIEQYNILTNYSFGTHLLVTDDIYYVTGRHRGPQTAVYSTNNTRLAVTGVLNQNIKNRPGLIELLGTYSMESWEQIGDFNFIRQESNNTL